MQRSALLDAARSLLSEGGMDALTFPALAERTGLARSSVYEYFRSRAAVVEELCAADFPVWAAEVEAAMRAADGPEGEIEAYVRRQLALAGDRRHRAVVAISAGELDAGAREKIRAAHGGLIDMVVGALAELGATASFAVNEKSGRAALVEHGLTTAADDDRLVPAVRLLRPEKRSLVPLRAFEESAWTDAAPETWVAAWRA